MCFLAWHEISKLLEEKDYSLSLKIFEIFDPRRKQPKGTDFAKDIKYCVCLGVLELSLSLKKIYFIC